MAKTAPRTEIFLKFSAKEAKLDINVHGDVKTLSHVTACSQAFAKKVLEAIHTNTEEDMYEQNIRNDSIKFTAWMGIIKDFVLSSENSRPIPGKETVSIKYGVRREKYLLQKSKHEIASDFNKLHPECPFEASTLIREFLQNAVTPTSRDMERNSCPTHSNIHRRVKALPYDRSCKRSANIMPRNGCYDHVC